MASGDDTSVASLIHTLNRAILAATSALIPKLHQSHASDLQQASQRLQIWSNNLGIGSGELGERLRDQQELEHSIVTLHIMIAQGLVATEVCIWKGKGLSSVEAAADLRSPLPLQLAIEALETEYPQFADNFSATSFSTRAQSIDLTNQSQDAISDIADHGPTNELDGTLAEVLATINRLIRLAPFLEQYEEDSSDQIEHNDADSTVDAPHEEADVHFDRILTRYPEASHEHVQIVVKARERMYILTDRRQFMSGYQEALETSILGNKEIPYPDIPQMTHGKISCSTCTAILPNTLSVSEWRLHLLDDYSPYTCLERDCSYDIRCFSRLADFSDHQNLPHSEKPQWICKLCGYRKFAAKSQLQYHAETVHYIPAEAAVGLCELWREEVAAQEEETECMFCNEAYGKEADARLTHLGRHMVVIALLMPAGAERHAILDMDKAYVTPTRQAREHQSATKTLSRKPTQLDELPLEKRFSRTGILRVASPPESDRHGGYTSDEGVEDGSEEEEEDEKEEEEVRYCKIERAQFVLEEINNDDADGEEDNEFLKPDSIEEQQDEVGPSAKKEVLDRLKELQLEEDSTDDEEQERSYRAKKKRWSAGVFKRSHSQSVEGDSSYSDNDPLDDVKPTMRRLRRRVRESGDRRSELIFDDRGVSNADDILEVDEPDEELDKDSAMQVDIPGSDPAFILDELPFRAANEDASDDNLTTNINCRRTRNAAINDAQS